MSVAARFDELSKRCALEVPALCSKEPHGELFRVRSEATLGPQDAPRASIANSRLLAITRLASPNRLNSCASFLTSPL
jgi:hypothetical protein